MSRRLLRALLGLTLIGSVAAPAPAPAADPSATGFRALTVDAQVQIGYGLALADVDGDRRIDIILADKQVVAWYRNPDWRKHVLAERLTELDNVCVAAADLDGDGKAEIAVGAGWNPGDTIGSGALFFLRAPPDRTQRWEPIRLAHDPTIHRLRWARNAEGRTDLISVPLHGRGNKNGQGDGVRILAYHPPSDPTAAWTTSLAGDRWHATHNFEVLSPAPGRAGDRLLVGAREGVFRLTPEAGSWRVEVVATNGPAMPDFVGAGEVRMGRSAATAFVATIEPMHGNQLAVYAEPPTTGRDLWQRKLLDATLVDGHAIVCADFRGLGRDQIAAGWRAMNRPGTRVGIRLYTPATDDPLGDWRTETIDDNHMACEDLQAADLDGDGDLDLVAAGRATRNLVIYLNERLDP